jgi:WD40 repeat protein
LINPAFVEEAMMQKKLLVFGLRGLFFATVLAACTSDRQTPAEATKIILQATNTSPPSTEFTQTTSPPKTPEPTPDPWALSQDNISNITLLESLGGPPIGRIRYMEWSMDGQWLLAWSDTEVALYDAQTLTLHWQTSKPRHISFSYSGDKIHTFSGNSLQIRSIPSGIIEETIEFKDMQAGQIVISPGRQYLAVRIGETRLSWWDQKSGERIHELDLFEHFEYDVEEISNFVFSQDGSNLFVNTFTGGVYRINLETMAVKQIFFGAFFPDMTIVSNITDECFSSSANGAALVVVCAHHTPTEDYSGIYSSVYTIKKVDLNGDNHQITTFESRRYYKYINVSPDGRIVYLHSGDESKQYIFESENIELKTRPSCIIHTTDPAFIGPNGSNKIAVVDSYEVGEFFIADPLSCQKQVALTFEPLTSLAIGKADHGYLIAAGRCTDEIELWDAEKLQIINSFQAHSACITDLDFSADGHFLASGGEDGNVTLWDMSTQEINSVFTATHPSQIKDLELNNNGSHLAVISENQFQLWDTRAGEELTSQSLDSGQNIALGSDNWLAYLDDDWVHWNTYTGLATSYYPKTGNLIFSPDASVLVSHYAKGNGIWFWDVQTGENIHLLDLSKKSNPFQAVTFSRDGCLLIGIPEYGNLHFWSTTPFNLLLMIDTQIESEDRIVASGISYDGHIIALGKKNGSIEIGGLPGVLREPPGLDYASKTCDQIVFPTPTSTPSPTNLPTSTDIIPPTNTATSTGMPSTPTSIPLTRNLLLTEPAMRGDDVLALQERLLELGYTEVGEPDGIFGTMTDEAVRNFQADHDLVVDGIVGQSTWEMLFAP